MPEPLVHLRGVHKRFGERSILHGFELAIGEGEFVALLGKSGSGKTTLLRMLAGLEPASAGELQVPQPCTVVFQEPRLVESKLVVDNVRIGLPNDARTREAALQALSEVGLREHADAWPRTLSGGEAQRVALARALLREPKLLLLDEPFAALDALTRLKMQALVADLCARHRPAVLLVTHDVDEALALADRVLVLAEGRARIDETITLLRPRRRTDLEAMRERMLGALGVPQA